MDVKFDDADMESGKKLSVEEVKQHKGNAFLEAAALLSVWSLLVINEGAIRLIGSNPAGGLSGGRPAVMLVFLGGLFEVIFGVVGLFVGIAAFILRVHSPTVTKLAMVVQTVLGYYVFAIYVFVISAVKASDLTEGTLPGLSLGNSRFLIALGVLTSFQFCLALQGGQFVFMARLVTAATGRDFLKQKSGNRMRAVFWNANLLLAGVWTTITGVLIHSNVGSGKLDVVFESPPNVGRLPGLTIFTGLLLVVWGIVGIAVAISKIAVPMVYNVGWGVVYLMALLNYGIVQFGMFEGAPAGAVALHNGLVFMVTFLGPYFVHLAAREKTGEEF